ncbi:unnamed protein product [Cylindrotheca closterium]|uniref:Pseudouridine synthase RsuA/RluA-like domain-containing protein n=1 Tax=Cylindrotheca closterium TaxID=2856 RepID=A0AAD2G710_9STRA|nr:unnamed protein product [Cylindrotheca closterium]
MASSNNNQDMTFSSSSSAPKPNEEKAIGTPATPVPHTDLPQNSIKPTTIKYMYSVENQNGTNMKVFMPLYVYQEMAAIHLKQQQQQPSKRPRIQNQPKSPKKLTMSSSDEVVNDVPIGTAAANTIATTNESSTTMIEIPESVRQYERQLRKMQAATRASTELSSDDLQIVYNDPHMVVVNKPSGFLTVPGVNQNPNLLSLVYETLQERDKQDDAKILQQLEKMEHMIVHRLDMDTSGLVIFAKTKESMAHLQASFRQGTTEQTDKHQSKKNRKKWKKNTSPPPAVPTKPIQKEYEALLCGHLTPDTLQTIQIDLPLQRDHQHPPFMRVATPTSEQEAQEVVEGLKHAGWKKIVKKKAKPSQTIVQVLQREYVVRTEEKETNDNGISSSMNGDVDDSPTIGEQLPVTRVRLVPLTGRTHQLRVHCAAIGHPILADPTYGILGEAAPNGGFDDTTIDQSVSDTADDDKNNGVGDRRPRASTKLQLQLDQWVKDHHQVMCLHARKLQLNHPITGEELCLEEAPTF